jgi:hypothetical protein
MLARIIAGAAVGGVVLAALAGCASPSPELKEKRQEFLNAAVEEFDATKLGSVLCDFEGGDAALGRGYTHTYLFSGEDAWQAIADRFVELGYGGDNNGSSMAYADDEGISASAHVIEGVDDDEMLVADLKASGCDAPPEGNVFLRFEERGPAAE